MPPPHTSTTSVRRARRRSRLTAAALVMGSGAAAVTLAYNVMPRRDTRVRHHLEHYRGADHHGDPRQRRSPHVAHTVATTSASGVTTTTTTQVVNGKTVVTKSTSAPAYHDRSRTSPMGENTLPSTLAAGVHG